MREPVPSSGECSFVPQLVPLMSPQSQWEIAKVKALYVRLRSSLGVVLGSLSPSPGGEALGSDLQKGVG